jgi:diguanylate cyclase (GGDEF)-like protein/PAS domain S-box-containing protein
MYGEIAEDIMFSDIYVASQMYAKKMYFSGEEYLIMLEMDQKILEAKQKTLLYYAMLIFLMIILISLPLAYLFSILPDRLNRKISEQKRLFETLSEHSLAGVFLYQKTFLYTNPHFEEYTGYSEGELTKLTMEDLFLSDPKTFGEQYKEALIRTKAGKEQWTYVGLNPTRLDNKPAIIGTVIDITELKRIQQELEHNAATDKLTGLANRVSFEAVFEKMRGSGHPLYLAFFDIDHFKNINDTFGHDAGDRVLQSLAKTLQRHLHHGIGHLFRWGGEEFIGLVDGEMCKDVEAFVEGLRQSIAESPMETVGHITVSIGLARFGTADTIETLVKRADEALYEAKESGRNKVVSRV